jgi:hypothetical protein
MEGPEGENSGPFLFAGGVMREEDKDAEEWRELARRASEETDPGKLADLVEQLLEAYDRYAARNKPKTPGKEFPRN